MSPLVSVVIPTYNRSGLLATRAVPSVLKQTYADLECIVVDDGSTDDTEEIVKVLIKRDGRVRYVKKENGGQASARNIGIRKSRGQYIALTDDDDEFFPGFIEEAVKVLKTAPKEVGFIGADVLIVDDWGLTSYHTSTFEPFWRNPIGGGCVFRREMFFDGNLFFDEDIIGLEDLDMHLQLHQAGYRGHIVHRPLKTYYATLRSQKTASWSTNYARQIENFEKFLQKNEELYRSLGRDAIRWLYFFGGITYARGGSMAKGRKFLLYALRNGAGLNCLVYYCAALCGGIFFRWYDRVKLTMFRILRSIAKFLKPAYIRHHMHKI